MAEISNTPQVELWQDVNRKLDKRRLENSLSLSLPKFMEAYGESMSKKDQEAFQVAVTDILSSIQNGNIGERTIARELVFKDGKERGTENKRMKQAYGLAANFVNSVIDAMPEYVAPVVVQKPVEKKQETTIKETVEESTQKKEEPQDPLSILQQKLNKKRDNRLQKLANWDVESSPILMQLPSINYNEDSVLGMYKKMNLGNGYASYFRNKISPEFFANLNSILSPEKLGNNDMQITNSFGKRMSAKQHIVNTLDFFIRHPELLPNNGEFNKLSSGKVTIPGSFNEDAGTILLYNPNNRTISRESITNEPELFQHYQYELGLIQPQQEDNNIVSINKNGGILKFAYGGTALSTNYISDQQLNNYINSYQTFQDKMQQAKQEKTLNAKQQKLQAVKQAADSKDRSIKVHEKMTTPISKKDLSGADITRLVSAIGDLGAVAASFAPGAGTLIGAGLGAASTLANLGADLADGDNVWNSLGRAGTNLGLDAIGLIPGAGATGKIAKIGKSLTKAAPWVLGAMAASNLGEEAKAFKKLITNPSNLNADDLNMIAGGLSLVLGLRTGYKARKIRKQALVKDKKGLVTDSGKVAVMDAEELKNLKTNEQLNAKLKSMKGFKDESVSGAFKNESKGYKNLWGYTLNTPKTIDIYNFKNMKGLDARVLERRAHGYLPIRGDKYKYNLNNTTNSNVAPKVTELYSPTYNMGFDPVLGHNVVYRKDGGILKAQQGNKLWSSNLVDYDPTKYISEYGNTLYGINENNQYTNGFSYGNNGIGKVNSRYKTDTRFSDYSNKGQNYAKSIETQKHYNNFSNDLYSSYNEYISDPVKFGNDKNLFYRWSKKYDSTLPIGSTSKFFDAQGNLNKNWVIKNQDAYGRDTSQTYTNGLEYLKHLRYDNLLATAHNDFLKEGSRYFRKDADGKEHWVDPSVISKYLVSKDPVRSSVDGNTKWNDYEITGLATEPYKLGEGQLHQEKTFIIDSISDFNKSPEGLKLQSDLSELARAYFIKQQNLKRLKAANNFQPYHFEHPTFQRQTTDMTNVLKSAYDNGAQAMAKNNIPRYADASLNEAVKRETAADVRQNIMQAENQNAEYINQQRDANDKLAMQNEQMRIDTANKNKQFDYAANEEKRINTMKIHEANTGIDNAVWMKHSYDLMQNAEKQSSLQDWWKQQQIGTLADEELRLLNSNDKYKQNRARLKELISQGKDPNDPEISKIVQEQEDLVNQIKMQANDSFLSRIQQIYGINTTPIKSSVIYQPQIALNKSGGSIKITTKTDSIEKAKLNARSKDDDRFIKSVSKIVDSSLAQDKQLGKSLLHKLTLSKK